MIIRYGGMAPRSKEKGGKVVIVEGKKGVCVCNMVMMMMMMGCRLLHSLVSRVSRCELKDHPKHLRLHFTVLFIALRHSNLMIYFSLVKFPLPTSMLCVQHGLGCLIMQYGHNGG